MRIIPAVFILALALIGCSSDSIVGPSLGTIRGVVKDPRTVSPLPNVQMYSIPGTSTVVSDQQGAYQIDGVMPGEYIVKAFYRDSTFVGYATLPVRVNSGATTTADIILKIGVPGKGVIAGRVVDQQGRPVVGATVETVPKTTQETTWNDGYFILTDIIYDSLTVKVNNGILFGSARVALKMDDIVKLVITAYEQDPSKGWFKGMVTSKGEPVSGAIVRIDSLNKADTTDDLGEYRISNIPVGTHRLSVVRSGFTKRSFILNAIADTATVKDISLGLTSSLPMESLELYLPFDASIDDRSPKSHKMSEMGKDLRFVPDRYGRPNEAIQFSGWNGVSTVDGSKMNFKPITMGTWLYIPSTTEKVHLVFGKTPHPTGDGYYIVLENNLLSFIWVTNGFKQVSRADMVMGRYPRNQWFWIGYAVGQDGSGYATVNGVEIINLSFVTNPIINEEQFTFGTLPSTTNNPGFTGAMDQAVVYSTFKTIEEIKRIMETKE